MYGYLLCYKKIRRIESALRKFKDRKPQIEEGEGQTI